MMDVHERFMVPADPRTVWGVVSDPQAVVGCVPGAALGQQHEDGSFDASVTVKFGPVRVTMQARVTLEMDDAAMVGHVTARGKDNQGGTRFASIVTFTITDASDSGGGLGGSPPVTTVAVDGDVELSGKLAGMIESGAPIVVKRMTGEFAENLARRCAA